MSDLLHEYWENDDGGDFGPVQKRKDELRPECRPNARLVFSLRASSWHQAMQLYHERMGYGDFVPVDPWDHVYTEEQAAEQDAYLKVRNVC